MSRMVVGVLTAAGLCLPAIGAAHAQYGQGPRLWLAQSGGGYLPPDYNRPRTDDYEEPRRDSNSPPPRGDAYRPPRDDYAPPPRDAYSPPPRDAYVPPLRDYAPPPRETYRGPPPDDSRTYSANEIMDAGHRFFGSVSRGLAKVVEHAFASQGRPNGYILGEEAGGAFAVGLRYGEGKLFTKFDGDHKVYWQGPSIGYDIGGEGSKTLILVYNLYSVDQIYQRFAGVDGSAYLVGGVGLTLQKQGDIILAPIRSGVGVRFGANIGYLKYTPYPTWNPF